MGRRGNGRSVEKERFWRGVLRRQKKSGLKVREFCRGEGLKESAFYFWKRTIAERNREKKSTRAVGPTGRRQGNASASRTGAFMPLSVVGEMPRLEIVSPDGWKLQVPNGIDGETLSGVIATLRQSDQENG